MKLSAYLDSYDLTDAEFARAIGVGRQVVQRYRHGSRIPHPRIMELIASATQGKVTPNDFYNSPIPRGSSPTVSRTRG
jgi:transcriptional regulator with XRE-family HTH domain